MKTTLTIEESAKLIELGVDAKLASEEVATTIYEQEYNDPRHPIFTLTDILSILPKEITTSETIIGDDFTSALYIEWDCILKKWNCGYYMLPRPVDVGVAPELIDALYQLLIWVIENGHLNKEKQ